MSSDVELVRRPTRPRRGVPPTDAELPLGGRQGGSVLKGVNRFGRPRLRSSLPRSCVALWTTCRARRGSRWLEAWDRAQSARTTALRGAE
jgi:hypothetical protein